MNSYWAKYCWLQHCTSTFYWTQQRSSPQSSNRRRSCFSPKRWNCLWFYIRSIRDSWISAWKIQLKENSKHGIGFWSLENQMWWFQMVQLCIILIIYFFFWRLDSFVLFGCCTNGHAIIGDRQLHWTLRPGSQAKWKWVLWAHDACTFLELKSFIGQGGFIGTNETFRSSLPGQQKIPDFAALWWKSANAYRLSGYDATLFDTTSLVLGYAQRDQGDISRPTAGMDLAWV